MSTVSKIASYAVTVAKLQGETAILLVPRIIDPNVPKDLHVFTADVRAGKPLNWKARAETHNDLANRTIGFDENGKSVVATYLPLAEGFAAHKAELAKALPTLQDEADVMQAAARGINLSYGRFYPGAAVESEDDLLNVVSDTKFAASHPAAPKGGKGGAAPKRAKGVDNVRIWLGGQA